MHGKLPASSSQTHTHTIWEWAEWNRRTGKRTYREAGRMKTSELESLQWNKAYYKQYSQSKSDSFLSVRCNKICSGNLLALFNCSSKLIPIFIMLQREYRESCKGNTNLLIQTCTHKHTKHIQYCPPFLNAWKGTLAFLRGGEIVWDI